MSHPSFWCIWVSGRSQGSHWGLMLAMTACEASLDSWWLCICTAGPIASMRLERALLGFQDVEYMMQVCVPTSLGLLPLPYLAALSS